MYTISAAPDVQVATTLFENVSARLWASFEYLLRSIGQEDSCFFGLISEYRNCPKAPPFFFAAHETLMSYYVRGEEVSKSLSERLLYFSSIERHSNLEVLPFLMSSGLQNEICSSVVYSDIRKTYDDADANVALPKEIGSESEFLVSRSLMIHALDIIRRADDALYAEMAQVVDEIRIFQSGYCRAGTNFNALGMIYVGSCSVRDTVSRYLEQVVRESAHNLLYAHWVHDPLFENHNDRLYPTPFRKQARPLSAIYQAAFVLARTIYVFEKIYKADPSALDFSKVRTNYNERGNEASFKDKFFQTLGVVYEHAELTVYGKSLIKSCQEMVEGCEITI